MRDELGNSPAGYPMLYWESTIVFGLARDYVSHPLLAQAFEFVGEWLSLVEHLVRDQGVGGSNPLSPTNLFKYINSISGFSVTPL